MHFEIFSSTGQYLWKDFPIHQRKSTTDQDKLIQ